MSLLKWAIVALIVAGIAALFGFTDIAQGAAGVAQVLFVVFLVIFSILALIGVVNGAYSRKQALAFAQRFAELGVSWFEEPVSSDDLDGLRLIRDRGPAGMDVAAGEYGYQPLYFRRMAEAGAVDVLQADASRCGGITGFLKAADVCESFGLPLSAHCAPALHLHAACAVTADFRHLEYFHDHARIEAALFDGAAAPTDGALCPDPARPGLGLEFKHKDAERFRVWAAEPVTK